MNFSDIFLLLSRAGAGVDYRDERAASTPHDRAVPGKGKRHRKAEAAPDPLGRGIRRTVAPEPPHGRHRVRVQRMHPLPAHDARARGHQYRLLRQNGLLRCRL